MADIERDPTCNPVDPLLTGVFSLISLQVFELKYKENDSVTNNRILKKQCTIYRDLNADYS